MPPINGHKHISSEEQALNIGLQVAESFNGKQAETIVICDECRQMIDNRLSGILRSDFRKTHVIAFLYKLGKTFIENEIRENGLSLKDRETVQQKLESIEKSIEEDRTTMPDAAFEDLDSLFKHPRAVMFMRKIAEQTFLQALLRGEIKKVIGDESFLAEYAHLGIE